MSLDLTTMRNLARDIIGSSTTYGTNDDTKRHTDSSIDDALTVGDLDVCRAIVETNGHPYRSLYVFRSDPLACYAPLPPSAGGYGAVLVDDVVASPLNAREIVRLKNTPLTRFDDEVFYDIVGNTLVHSGNSAVVEIINLSKTSSLQAPDSYAYAVLSVALSILFSKDGAEMQAAAHFAQEAQFRMQLVKSGATIIPAVEAYQKGAAE